MKSSVFLFYFLAGVMISGCTATTTQIYRATGSETICGKPGTSLGYIAVLPEMAWRADQKEPEKRQQMALEEMERAFGQIACGTIAPPGGIREVAEWSGKPESELLKAFASEGVDTVILVRIEELTPLVHLTFSLPFLWAGASEADFRIRALSVKSGAVLADMRVKRSTGGPFQLRPAEWARIELNAALKKIMEENPPLPVILSRILKGAVLGLEWRDSQETVDWNELSDLYRVAPLGVKRPGDIEKAFTNSMFKYFVFDQGRLVGAGRALADGVDCSYICDVAVLPGHQGRGIGKSIVSRLVEASAGHKKIILYAYPGKEAFYRKLGFKRMSTAMAIFENQNQALEWGLVNET